MSKIYWQRARALRWNFEPLSGLIPANCTTGDSVYLRGYDNVTIDGETTRAYAGANRKVIYRSFSQYGNQFTFYWNKQTGVMVEGSATSGNMISTNKAIETNMWQAIPFWMQWWLWWLSLLLDLLSFYFLENSSEKIPQKLFKRSTP